MKRSPRDELRRRAEERLGTRAAPSGKGKTQAELARLVHELEVHQIELELQNEELQMARADLDSALSRYSDLYDFAPTGYVTIGRDGVIRQANLEAARLLGVERSRLEGRRLPLFIAANDRRAFGDFLPRAFTSRATERCEVALAREGKEPVLVRIEFRASEDGQTGRAMLLDVTELRRAEESARAAEGLKLELSERSRMALLSVAEDARSAAAALAASEQALRESEEKARALVEYAPTGIYEIDLGGGKFISVNDAMCRTLGYTREELLAIGPLGVLEEESRARFADRVKRTLSGQAIDGAVDYRVTRKDGSVVDAVLYVTFNPDGGRALVVAHDVTERKQAERRLRETLAELKRSNEDLEQYAYVASHDLQEPLRMVANYVELLRRRYQGKLDDNADKYIGYAAAGAMRMQQLVHDLLAYSRVGARELVMQPVRLDRVVAQARANVAMAASEAGAVIEVGPLPTVSGDEPQLVQLFQNLFDNAVKFRGAAPPKVSVTCHNAGEECEIVVQDNGIGIEPKHGDRVFRLFQRLHTHEEYPGTGIGLAVCRKIVERHGGRIRVEPAQPQGSRFVFTLPPLPAPAGAGKPNPARRPENRGNQ